MSTLLRVALDKSDNPVSNNGWEQRHADAVRMIRHPKPIESAYVGLVDAWERYGKAWKAANPEWGSGIGDDSYCGPEWASIGKALIALLSADHGKRLDGGLCDTAIRQVFMEHGLTEDGD